MSITLISLIAAICFGLFFLVISLFSKREDYLLDDYTHDDKPDNVRIIERDITKIVEKEVEVVVEVIVEKENTQEIDRLSNELKKIISNESELQNVISSKELELNNTHTTISNIELDFNNYKIDIEKRLKESLNKNKELSNVNISISNENTLIKKSMDDQQLENNNLIIKLKDDKIKLETSMSNLVKDEEIAKSKNKKSVDKIIEDRDYFIKLVEKKDKEISSIKHDLNHEYKKHPNVYEGVDEYGSFYDITLINNKFPNNHVIKIIDVSNKLEPDQFAYYGINTHTDFENIEVYNISKLSSFIEIVQKKKTEGRYKIYIIFDNRVYYYVIY